MTDKIFHIIDESIDYSIKVEVAVADEIIRFQKTGTIIAIPGTIVGARTDWAPPIINHFIMSAILGHQYDDVIDYDSILYNPSCPNDELKNKTVIGLCDPCWAQLS
ncbi:hypothetical protein LCGC14_0194870 [marine sediment metagenome]|uniref:Uncharacterized protein n=1 Tax=marine sediment metagenome TaxID=412755 RepID=A0A0F9UK75_9ZZZZ